MKKPSINLRVSKNFYDFTKRFMEKNSLSSWDATEKFRRELKNKNKIREEYDLL